MPELSVIVPCKNDASVLNATLDGLHIVAAHHSMSVETLIVDDDSDDDTIATAIEAAHRFPALHIRVLARKRLSPGLGGVLRYGMAYATGRYCMLVAPGSADPIDLIPIFVNRLRSGRQLVQCSPPPFEKEGERVRPFQWMYQRIAQAVLNVRVLETTYTFRAFDRAFVLALGLCSKHHDVCPEMTFKVLLCGGSVEYVPRAPNAQRRGLLASRHPMRVGGYVYVLMRATLHRMGLRRWF